MTGNAGFPRFAAWPKSCGVAEPDPSIRHSLAEDAMGLSLGVFVCGLGVHVMAHVGLLTGQTAGIALILSYLTNWSFGAVFFIVNLPFYLLAYFRLGTVFTVKSLISVTALSLVTEFLPLGLTFETLNIGLAAVMSGAMIGIGLLAMFRHGGSLGGMGVVALLIQDTFGFRAGYVQLIADAIIFGVAFFLFPWQIVLWSLIGAVVLNGIIAVNHRRDRYIAT